MKKFRLCRAAGIFIALGLPLAVNAAQSIKFDPDGTGGAETITVTNFDWLPSSALAVNTLPLPTLPTKISSTLLTHAKLGNFLDANGKPILGTGLNSNYEITFVARAGQLGALINTTTSLYSFESGVLPNFFEVYWDDQRDASDLDGTDFNNGTLIMTGTITALSANFSTTSITPVLLDQFGANDWLGLSTGSGVGGGKVVVEVVFANPDFFPDPDQQPKTVFFNTSQILPFLQVDPSKHFTNTPFGGGAPIAPVLGAVNGLATAGGKDVIFQADSNMGVTLIGVPGVCRMTGGGVTVDGQIVLEPGEVGAVGASGSDGLNRYTFGGQVGAPTTTTPVAGEWTHHQFQGPAGDFVFRVGTASAPKDTMVMEVECLDPGYCSPARPAPDKQLNWNGIGSFRTARGAIADVVNPENGGAPGYSRHYVRVHVEDLGEPGPGGKQPHSEDCTHVIGTIVGNPQQDTSLNDTVCSNCADVYQIEIHATTDPTSAVIYSVGGFMDVGNLQLHPPTGHP
ncbi:hypothetical protein [Aromatoleum evansii]|uniref:hypothetical protein n=1 Tax=Aromatoleum evansii TaxID=59406 RepID=UPI00145F1B66|nr:hypothetical protein [Aromatoleum evansii]NMG31717.1 hypothetical protein [Aromatoleum evansii]